MKEKILDDFIPAKRVPLDVIVAYEDKLPEQIIQIWKDYGFGTFMNGFMKVINPSDFQELIQRAYYMGTQSIPVFATALGDLIIWEDNSYLTILRFRHGVFAIMESGCKYFLDDLTDEDYVNDFLKPRDYFLAIQKHGSIEYDECFGYVPLLCLGGPENADNLERVKLLEHLELILAISGPVM